MDEPSALAAALSGRYEIDREVGRGGITTVYLPRDLRRERIAKTHQFRQT